MRGYWTTTQLVDVVRLFVLNMDALDGLESGFARPRGAAAQDRARLAPQQPRRRAPQHRRALRPRQRFLPAVPRRDDDVLGRDVRASAADRCTTRRSRGSISSAASSSSSPTDHLLEIGSGWGGLALHAAQRFGCRVTTTTISREQWRLDARAGREAGLGDRIEVLCEDYRDLTGTYDKLVSIEMIEAIGHQYYDTYFAQVQRAARARRRDAAAGHHDRRTSVMNARGARWISSSATSSRAAAFRRWPR